MKLKKRLTVILAGIITLGLLAGCQSNNEETAKTNNNEQSSTADLSKDLGNTLIVYYSATGNTEEVAKMIAEQTTGTLFEIEPKEPYSDDDLNWDSYDTVFIGYPIWWGIAAWPVDNFVKNNDFTGKTIIPFCTSSSSDLGESGELLAEMAGTGNWQEGQRFRSSASDSDVQEWLNDLGVIQ